jgi:hypothetical protein
MTTNGLIQNKSTQSMMNVGHEDRPVWKEHRRPIDDPQTNFEKLRGKWTTPKAKPRLQIRKGGAF